MVFFSWLVLFLVIVSFFLILLAFSRHAIYQKYSGARPVACPQDQRPAVVNIDLRHAAETAVDGRPSLRLSECTCWPERANCNQECLTQAIHAEPYKEVTVKSGKKQIYHLPVLLAAFASWYVGMIWHSQYFFRAQWMHAVGLTQEQLKQIAWWLSPHLLTAAVCLLFAYGVAWLLAVSHRKGVLAGVLMSVLLCGAVVVTTFYGMTNLSRELLLIEAGYAVLATLIVGSILGGLSGKLVLRSQ